ncbi:hypothetical protein INR49_001586 [Caranx melampygus]|nr:hypothetical protein INR49_001586 [Caranx melampygus]
MEFPLAFLLILTTAAFAPDYVCSQSLNVSENPVPVGNNLTLYGPASVTTGAWLFDNNIIVLIIPGDQIISNGDDELINGGQVELSNGNATLTIHSVTRDDEGPFRCNVSNGVSHEISAPVYLNISYGPSNTTMMITPMAPHYIYRTGTNITLQCSAMSSPPAVIMWMLDEKYMNGYYGSYLHLVNVTESNSGNYKCVLHNTVTSRFSSASTMLLVLDGPGMPIITGPTVAKTGCSVTFRCNASSYPPSHYTWYFNHTLVANTSAYETPPLTKNMSGVYTCKAYNYVTGQNKTAYTMLTVVDPIEDVSIEAPQKPPIEGNPYELHCNVTGPAEYVYWMMNGMKLHGHNTTVFSMDNTTVTFKPLNRYSTGNYSCKAMNAVGNMTSAPYMLLVNFGPETPHIYGPEFAETGTSVTFNCSAMSQPPSRFTWCSMAPRWPILQQAIKSVMIKNKTLPINTDNFTLICEVDGPYDMIYWKKNGQYLNMNTSDSDMYYHIKDNMLHFTPVTLGSEGQYHCEAVNRAAEHSSPKYTLLVMYGPLHVYITGPDSEKQGVSVSLKCSADSRPDCDFYWFFNDTSEPENTGSVITFTAGEETQGTYTCKAMNRVTNITMFKTKAFSLSASAFHLPSQGNLMLMGVFALFVPAMFN